MSAHTFTFMGTGAGCGVPAFFCECPACKEAADNPKARRGTCGTLIRSTATGIGATPEGNAAQLCYGDRAVNEREDAAQTPLVTGNVIIDTPADLRLQFLRENVQGVDALLYTHAHFDHLGGLGELEYFIRLVRNAPLPVYGSAETLAGLKQEFHYMLDCLEFHELAPFDSVELEGVVYTALPVTHAPGTYGYLIEEAPAARNTASDAAGARPRRLFYACDTGTLPPETAERVRGVDVLAWDATFWKNSWSAHHHSVQTSVNEGLELDAKKIYLTHLAMHYAEPVTLAQLEEYVGQWNGRVEPAWDGLAIEL